MQNNEENTIKRLSIEFSLLYAGYILTAALFALVYESQPLAKGFLAGNATAAYVINPVCIMLTLLIVPLSIKVFGNMLTRHLSLSFPERVARYRMLWGTRIVSFAIVTIFDLWAYYATVNNIGGFCALICIVTSLLFIPSRKHIRDDLNEGKK